MLARYFIHGQPMGYGEPPASMRAAADLFKCDQSHAFWCTTCGEVWARIRVSPRQTYIHHVPCEAHRTVFASDSGEWPGSLLRSADLDMVPLMDWPRSLDSLPADMLAWEFKVHLMALERAEAEGESHE